MRSTTLVTSKAASALNQTQKCNSSTSAPRRKLRRRYLSSHVATRLSPCPEEQAACLVTSSVNNSPVRLTVRPYSPLTGRPTDAVFSNGSHSHRPVMPPGPPTSPVPSPPQSSSLTLDLAPDFPDDTVAAGLNDDSGVEKRLPNLSNALRTRLRRRRNAICANSALGQGLKDFFASYVMSHLTDSMTSSLNLDSSTDNVVFGRDVSIGNRRPHLTPRSRLSCSPHTLSPFSNDTETSME